MTKTKQNANKIDAKWTTALPFAVVTRMKGSTINGWSLWVNIYEIVTIRWEGIAFCISKQRRNLSCNCSQKNDFHFIALFLSSFLKHHTSFWMVFIRNNTSAQQFWLIEWKLVRIFVITPNFLFLSKKKCLEFLTLP